MSLNAKNFGLAGGILVSLTLFGVAWHAILTDLGNALSETETMIRFCSNRFNFWKLNKGKLRGLFVTL